MWENAEEAFKELDTREYSHYASALGSYLKALEGEGFRRSEAVPIVQGYAKFLYDMALEELISEKRRLEAREMFEEDMKRMEFEEKLNDEFDEDEDDE